MSRQFNFNSQKSVGNIGEKMFVEMYKNAIQADGREHDFTLDGKTVEIKSDSYTSLNYFMERYGNIEKQSNGGPWQSLEKKIDWFVYLFLKEKTFYWFNTVELCEFLDEYILKNCPKSHIIDNKTWASFGYLIPRKDIDHLLKRKDSIE